MALKLDAKIPAGPLAEKWSNHKAAIKVVSPANKRKLDIIVVGTGLGGASAAASLGEQLPITVEVEDFSTNEKIFYPPQELDTSDTPAAEGGAGTLAYYAPWGDVVMFYGEYSENSSLYELGHVVSGGELIPELAGTVEIEAVQ